MRSRKEIAQDGTRKEDLIVEVLLDIRDILIKATKKKLLVFGGGLKTPTKKIAYSAHRDLRKEKQNG